MSLLQWLEHKTEKLKWWDVALVKVSVFFFAFFLVTFLDDFRIFITDAWWGWYLIFSLVAAAPVVWKVYVD
jgi:hypothetical protein